MKSSNGAKVSYSVWVLNGLILIGFLGGDGISQAAEGTWTYKADIPTPRVVVGGGVVDGKIYVMGGATSNSSVTSAVEMYDPIVNTWTKMANMPSGRCGHATCTFDGKIYVLGGVSPDPFSTAKKNVYVYDPQTDAWIHKADMPYTNAYCGIAVVDGTIYLIGGVLAGLPVPTVMAYDPITESWTQKADMPTSRCFLSTSVVDGKIYAIGGSKEDWRVFSYKHVEVYNPSTDTWTRKSDMPTGRWGLGTCVVDGQIYAIGGRLGSDACTANEVYDPITDTWTIKSPMQQKRKAPYVCSIGDKIYAISGAYDQPQQTFLLTVEEYDTGLGVPSPDFNGDEIVDIQDLLLMIEYWGQDDPLVDIAPSPFGDGVVDVHDLELLMSYWEQSIDDPTLVAHWALDETEDDIAYDSAGVNDAVVVGSTEWKPDSGQVDGALQLNGIDGYAVTGQVLNPANGPFSVFTWVNGGALGQVVLSQLNGANWLRADPDMGCVMTELIPIAVGRFAPQPLISECVITDGQWHRIGFVWDGANRALYVDDILVVEDTQNNLSSSLGGLNIGCGSNSETGTFWSGLIDDVRIYNRAVRP